MPSPLWSVLGMPLHSCAALLASFVEGVVTTAGAQSAPLSRTSLLLCPGTLLYPLSESPLPLWQSCRAQTQPQSALDKSGEPWSHSIFPSSNSKFQGKKLQLVSSGSCSQALFQVAMERQGHLAIRAHTRGEKGQLREGGVGWADTPKDV